MWGVYIYIYIWVRSGAIWQSTEAAAFLNQKADAYWFSESQAFVQGYMPWIRPWPAAFGVVPWSLSLSLSLSPVCVCRGVPARAG